MNLEHLKDLRLAELERVLPVLAEEAARLGRDRDLSVLEIGAGTGDQAKRLAEEGWEVAAVDLEDSNYAGDRVWPVVDYDGQSIPFEDESFDVVFSSNVLEHIPHLAEFHGEMQRVLRPSGVAVHIVPSGSWRFWTILAHYPAMLVRALRFLLGSAEGAAPAPSGAATPERSRSEGRSFARRLRGALVPGRHGERGTALTELFHFSRRAWRRCFARGGWKIGDVAGNRLFYTGYALLGPRLSIPVRRSLSRGLGSSCHVFVLKRRGPFVENDQEMLLE